MKRVVHLIGRSTGGIRRQVLRLAEHPPTGYETAGVIGPRELSGFFKNQRFVAYDGLRPWAELRPDILHAHGLTAAGKAIAGEALRSPAIPVVATVHTARGQTLRADLPGAASRASQELFWLAGRLILRRAKCVIVPSGSMKKDFKEGVVVPPVIDLPLPLKGRDEVRTELGASPGDVVVLAVARLHPDKALDVFIDAVAATKAAGWIAGDGPERDRLQGLATGTRVQLLGHREDIGSLLAAADVFALPARAEAYGFAVIEAVAAGLPVLATATGAIPELVGDAGIIVDPYDRPAFAETLRQLVEDEALRRQLAGKARARDLPSVGELTARLGSVYNYVLRPAKAEKH